MRKTLQPPTSSKTTAIKARKSRPGKKRPALLRDHVDARLVAAESAARDRRSIVQLDPDHPGFRDPAYRERRNRIARIGLEYRSGYPIPDAPYTREEHALWRTVREALDPVHARYACAEYLRGSRRLDLPRERIPQLAEVSTKVHALSGFRLEPVAGLVEPRVFLESLAESVFLCTQYIRHHSTPFYTPEPDVVHELLGHASTLASPRLARLNRLFGETVRRTRSPEALERLSRVYWFTIEFGVVREDGTVKAVGTGLLSSAGEIQAMHEATMLPLDLEAASVTDYDPTHYQPRLFCASSFDELEGALERFLAR